MVLDFWKSAPGLDPRNYSSASWLADEPALRLPIPGQAPMAVETLPTRFLNRFPTAVWDEETDTVPAIVGAMRCLSVGGADAAVRTLVRSVHRVAARAPGYDLSHSEPAIPFSVFVSIPVGEPHGAMRVAESLLHEAMHLQLTLIERHAPLTTGEGEAYSPWQQCARPIQGILHGLYVFGAIDDWLSLCAALPFATDEACAYARGRQAEIAEEVADVADVQQSAGLTTFGAWFARALLARFAPKATTASYIS